MSVASARTAAVTAPAWRAVLAPPAVALATLIAALVATDAADVAFRDPDNVAAQYFVAMAAAVAGLIGLDVWIRAARAAGTRRPPRELMRAIRRERWTAGRTVSMLCALLSFYVTYLAYRNLKAVIPMLRPGDLFDAEIAALDRSLFFGHDPAVLLHDLFGVGAIAHVLSAFYAAFIVFLPLSLAIALVFARDLQTTLFYATALSVNWGLGIATYYAWPALGPIYADAATFDALPHTEVTRLQQMLLDDRIGWLQDPATATPQAIAAFASLHVAMSFTALLTAHLLNLGRRLKIALWAWMAVTLVATVYFGWHYVLDDVAGLAIGALALVIARAMTGFDWRAARRREGAT